MNSLLLYMLVCTSIQEYKCTWKQRKLSLDPLSVNYIVFKTKEHFDGSQIGYFVRLQNSTIREISTFFYLLGYICIYSVKIQYWNGLAGCINLNKHRHFALLQSRNSVKAKLCILYSDQLNTHSSSLPLYLTHQLINSSLSHSLYLTLHFKLLLSVSLEEQ